MHILFQQNRKERSRISAVRRESKISFYFCDIHHVIRVIYPVQESSFSSYWLNKSEGVELGILRVNRKGKWVLFAVLTALQITSTRQMKWFGKTKHRWTMRHWQKIIYTHMESM